MVLIQVSDAFTNLDTVGKQFPGECADPTSLVEDRLLRGIRSGDQFLGAVGVPEQLGALKSPKVFGLRDERQAGFVCVPNLSRMIPIHTVNIAKSRLDSKAGVSVVLQTGVELTAAGSGEADGPGRKHGLGEFALVGERLGRLMIVWHRDRDGFQFHVQLQLGAVPDCGIACGGVRMANVMKGCLSFQIQSQRGPGLPTLAVLWWHPTALRTGSSTAKGFGDQGGEVIGAGTRGEVATGKRSLTAPIPRPQRNKQNRKQPEVEHVRR